jgi:phytol kinase
MLADWIALILAFVYVTVAIGVGELLKRRLGLSQDLARKFIHVVIGMISVPTVLLFQSLGWAIIPPLAFIVINTLDYRLGIVQAMASSDRSNLGTVYFPLSFAVILVLFWGRPHLVVAAMMPMTWGDALAAVVGSRWGQRHYTILGHQRSLEGSAIMFAASLLATFLALGPLPPAERGLIALATALGASAAEALSPWGIDNLTVPAVSALVLALMA